MKDSYGCVSDPLLNGSRYCKLHLQLLCTRSAKVDGPLLFYLDFQTTGLDVVHDYSVEVGLLCENSECFSTVLCSPVLGEGPNVHGTEEDELREGPSFNVALRRLCRFSKNIAETMQGDGT